MASICDKLDLSRQAYYKKYEAKKAAETDEKQVVKWVKAIRRIHPKRGAKKLYNTLKPRFKCHGIRLGRDRFIELLRSHNLLVKNRRKYQRTTQSDHHYFKYPNLIKDMILSHRNQVWVSDITYISTHEGFLYLSLITDAYTRKIVGYEVNDTLEAVGCIRALKKAFRGLEKWEKPIHHSDRGIQYCCKMYTSLLRKKGLKISMTEVDHCAENALAERVNGILKGEYMLDFKFHSKLDAIICCKEAIRLYNTDRPHYSINLAIPSEFHEASIGPRA